MTSTNNDASDDDVTHLVEGRVLLGLPDELDDDDDERQKQTADEHDEHPAHVTARGPDTDNVLQPSFIHSCSMYR